MTLEAPMRCSALAEQLGEPMIGTVDQRERWLLLEDRSAWGSHAVRERFGADVEARAKELGVRLLLVRRREGDPADDAVRAAILVDTLTGEMVSRTVSSAADLSVEAAAAAPLSSFGEPLAGPLFLVCTNGKRDACCALRGRALIATLAATQGNRVWETTHLGGHRFAGNLVCLPDGIVYGRVAPLDGPRLADAYVAGRLDPSFLRGRSAWPAPAQVAEQVLRERMDLDGLADVRLEEATLDADHATVVLRTRTGAHTFELHADRLQPARPTSCRADDTEAPLHWVISAAR
ncbi:MAG TPA: sucrase ferredoxin [Candidatus Limnocylindria bacterium]|nr:sucrase ferredoxin [Candidatus Limnocylindria bacterium]